MTNRTLIKAVRKAQRAQSAEADEYAALEKQVGHAQAVWINERGSLDGFYEANRDDMDKLQVLYNAMHAPLGRPKAPSAEANPTDRALIQLWLPLGQREAFRAVCKREGLSLSAKLRAMIAREVE